MSQTLQASTLLAVPLAPLVGSALAGIFGTRLGGNWIGRTLSHTLTILGVLTAFVLSALTLQSVVVDGARFNETLYTWMVVGGLKMEVGFLIDGLTAMMMCVVTFVSLMVHLYTIGYMEEDDGYNRFFAYISLFTFSMLMLVMSNNMLQLFFGWEAVGLVSYLLIGFWFNKPSAVFANMKAFLVNRVGDFGFLLGIAEAPSFPANAKATGHWFPRTERALSTALFDAAAKFSNVVGVPLVALAVVGYGWRAGFVWVAALSFAYFVAYWRLYRDPSAHEQLTAAERDYIAARGAAPERSSMASLHRASATLLASRLICV